MFLNTVLIFLGNNKPVFISNFIVFLFRKFNFKKIGFKTIPFRMKIGRNGNSKEKISPRS